MATQIDPTQLRYTYIASDNTGTNGVALGVADEDILIHSLVFGTPADGKVCTVYDKPNPVNGATTDIAFKTTQPTAAAGKQYVNREDFGGQPLHLGNGGAVIFNGSDLTVIWSKVV
jgi:hypothetical protein